MAIIVTDEMRAAVHDEDCGRMGHDFSLDDAFQQAIGQNASPYPELGSRNPNELPHLSCRRCGRVFLILEDAGADYADAETKLKGRLKDPTTVRVTPPKSQAPERAPAVTPGRFSNTGEQA